MYFYWYFSCQATDKQEHINYSKKIAILGLIISIVYETITGLSTILRKTRLRPWPVARYSNNTRQNRLQLLAISYYTYLAESKNIATVSFKGKKTVPKSQLRDIFRVHNRNPIKENAIKIVSTITDVIISKLFFIWF